MGKWLRLGAATLGSLAFFTTVLSNLKELHFAFYSHFWLVWGAGWILATAAAWPEPERPRIVFPRRQEKGVRSRISKYASVLLVQVAFFGLLGWRSYRLNHVSERVQPGEWFDPNEATIPAQAEAVHRQGLLPLDRLFRQMAAPRITSFQLSERKTSYRETASPTPAIRYFTVPSNWDHCGSVGDDPRLLESLRRFVRSSNRPAMLPYLNSASTLKNLVDDGNPVLRQIMPRGGDWYRVPDADREVIMRWMRDCVGLMFPVFQLTLHNPNGFEITIHSVRYYIIAAVEGGLGPGQFAWSIFPVATYPHVFRVMPTSSQRVRYRPDVPPAALRALTVSEIGGFFAASIQRNRRGEILIMPPSVHSLQNPTPTIPARGTVSFEVQLASVEQGQLQPVLMNMEILSSAGNVRTGEFVVELGTGAG